MNQAKAYFDAVADEYESRSEKPLWQITRKSELKAVLEFCGPLENINILELGCGAGFYTKQLLRAQPKSVTVIDFSHSMLEKLKNFQCTRIEADLESTDLAERFQTKFDLILCAGALEFTKDTTQVFKNVSKLLNANGSFILLTPNDSILGGLYQRFHQRHGIQTQLFSPKKIQSLAKQSALKLVAHKTAALFSIAAKLTHDGPQK